MRTIPQQLLPFDPRTASGDSGVIDTSRGYDDVEHSARLYLDVAAPTGTSPTLTVFVYGVINNKNYLVTQFTQVTTTASRQTLRVDNLPKDVVISYAIGGTSPSYTFEVWITR